jgi:hypothetical protein
MVCSGSLLLLHIDEQFIDIMKSSILLNHLFCSVHIAVVIDEQFIDIMKEFNFEPLIFYDVHLSNTNCLRCLT